MRGGDLRAGFFQQLQKRPIFRADFFLKTFLQPNGQRRGPAVGGNRDGEIAAAVQRAEAKAAMLRVVHRVAEDIPFFGETEDFGIVRVIA